VSGVAEPGQHGDPFAALGLPARSGLSDEDVRAAWRRIAAATHPDREDGGDPAVFGAAAAAYVTLRTDFGRGEALADLGEVAASATRRPGRHRGQRGQGQRGQRERSQRERGQRERSQRERGQHERSQRERGQRERSQRERSQREPDERGPGERERGERGPVRRGAAGRGTAMPSFRVGAGLAGSRARLGAGVVLVVNAAAGIVGGGRGRGLLVRVMVAGAASTAFLAAGGSPGTVGVLTGALSWLVIAGLRP
jgi:curved DNA-binding protein CbpA